MDLDRIAVVLADGAPHPRRDRQLVRALIAAESQRFPEVSRAYVDDSWNRNIDMLAQAFAELQRRGMLRVDDPLTAAQQFTWLTIAEPRKNGRSSGTAGVQTSLASTSSPKAPWRPSSPATGRHD